MAKSKNNDSIQVDFCITGRNSFVCGDLPNDKVYGYLKKLTKQDMDAEHCQSYGFAFLGYPYSESFKQQLIIKTELQFSGDGFGMIPLCSARTVGGCFRNIKSGKCRDPFIVKNIGKVFWPEKYGKQK